MTLDPCPRCHREASRIEVGSESVRLECGRCGADYREVIRNPATGAPLHTSHFRIPFSWSRALRPSELASNEAKRLDERIEANRKRGQRVAAATIAYRDEVAERAKRLEAEEESAANPTKA